MLWVEMVLFVAMDIIFPTGSAKIGRDGCLKKDTHTHAHTKMHAYQKRPNHCKTLAASFSSFVEKPCILLLLMTVHLIYGVM